MDDWALAGQFSCTGELWLNEQRIECYPPQSVRLAFFSRMHCYLTVQRRAKFTAGATGDT